MGAISLKEALESRQVLGLPPQESGEKSVPCTCVQHSAMNPPQTCKPFDPCLPLDIPKMAAAPAPGEREGCSSLPAFIAPF